MSKVGIPFSLTQNYIRGYLRFVCYNMSDTKRLVQRYSIVFHYFPVEILLGIQTFDLQVFTLTSITSFQEEDKPYTTFVNELRKFSHTQF